MNPEMMRQMLERMAAARASDPANGDGRNPRMPYDPSNGEGGRFLRGGNSNPAQMPFIEGDSNAVDMPQIGMDEDPARGDATATIQRILAMLRGGSMGAAPRMRYGGMGEQGEDAKMASAPPRTRLAPEMGSDPEIDPITNGNSPRMMNEMANRAREMARRAAIQRMMSSLGER